MLTWKAGEGWAWSGPRSLCSFGITEALVGALVGIGIGGETAAIAAPALLGAAGGAAISGVTGGNPLIGALGGGLTGGLLGPAVGLGGDVGSALGIGTVGGDVLVGSGVGALTSAIGGTNPLTGAVEGGIAGGAIGLSTGGGAGAGSASAPAGPSAAGAPIIGPGGGAGPIDLTTLGTGPTAAGGTTGALDAFASGTGGAGGSFGAGGGGAGAVLDTLGAGGTAGGGVPITGAALTTGATDAFASGAGGTGGAFATTPTPGTGLTAEQLLSAGGTPDGVGTPTISGATSTSGSGGIWDKLTSAVSKNPLGIAAAGGGLLYNMFANNKIPGQDQLAQTASQLASQGKTLASYLQSGNLPPGLATAIDQATAAAKARIKSQYASMGMSGSTAEIQDLNNVDLTAISQGAQIAGNLLKTGIDETNLAAGIYENLITINEKQSAATGQAIANFAMALSGGPSGITLKVA